MKHLALLLALLAAPPALCPALADELRRGPAEIRDGQLLAQPRLTLPALSPHTVRQGAWELQASALWSNSFSWVQDVSGEEPEDRRFLIDGESLALDLQVRRGLGPNLDVGLHVPVQGRGGGSLDGFIDWWHRVREHAGRRTPALLEGRLPRRRDHDERRCLLLERQHRLRPGRRRARGPLSDS